MEDKVIEEQAEEPQTPESSPKSGPSVFAVEFYSWFDSLFHAVTALVVICLFIVRVTNVDGTSMLPTLEDGEWLTVSIPFYQPDYNDIVVVWSDDLPNDKGTLGKPIIKRVIGLSGDTVSIDYLRGYVYRNGEQLQISVNDDMLYEDGHPINSYTNYEEGRGGEFVVPEGYIFVMGDNRNGSTDSRSSIVGYVDKREVLGKAFLRVWPLNKLGGLY